MSTRKAAQDAARHHSTLNAFAAVVAILEGGVVYDDQSYLAVNKIIKLCKDEMGRQLGKYDKAIDKATGAES